MTVKFKYIIRYNPDEYLWVLMFTDGKWEWPLGECESGAEALKYFNDNWKQLIEGMPEMKDILLSAIVNGVAYTSTGREKRR